MVLTDPYTPLYAPLRSPRRQATFSAAAMGTLFLISLLIAWGFTLRRTTTNIVDLQPDRVVGLSVNLPKDWHLETFTKTLSATQIDSNKTTHSQTPPTYVTLTEPRRNGRRLVITPIQIKVPRPPHAILNSVLTRSFTPQEFTALTHLRTVSNPRFSDWTVASYAIAQAVTNTNTNTNNQNTTNNNNGNNNPIKVHIFAVLTRDGRHWWALHLIAHTDPRRLFYEQAQDADRLVTDICRSATDGVLPIAQTALLDKFKISKNAQRAIRDWTILAAPNNPTPTPTLPPSPSPSSSPPSPSPSSPSPQPGATTPNAKSPPNTTTPPTDPVSAHLVLIPNDALNRLQVIRVLALTNGKLDTLPALFKQRPDIKITHHAIGPFALESATVSRGNPNQLYIQYLNARIDQTHGVLLELVAEQQAIGRLHANAITFIKAISPPPLSPASPPTPSAPLRK